MKFFHFIINIFIVILAVSFMFFINLYCTADISTAIWICMLIISFIFIIVSLACKRGRTLSFFYFKGKKGIISLFIIIILIVFNSYFVTVANVNVEDNHKGNVTAVEKTKIYNSHLDKINKELFYKPSILLRKKITMKKVNYSYITFYYNDKKDLESIQLIESFLDSAERNANRNLGTSKNLKVDVIMCHDKKTMNDKKWGGGYSYRQPINTIFIYDYDNSGLTQYKNLFNHAYFLYRVLNFVIENKIPTDNIPAWFSVGLEGYYMYGGEKIRYSPEDLKEPLDFRKLDKFEDFKNLKTIQNYDPYLQSYYAVYYITTKDVPGTIKDILLKSKEQGFYPALKSVTGLDIDEFQKQYLKDRIDEYNNSHK